LRLERVGMYSAVRLRASSCQYPVT